jgi:hypothetical protein
MVASPAPVAVTVPAPLTVATAVFDDFHGNAPLGTSTTAPPPSTKRGAQLTRRSDAQRERTGDHGETDRVGALLPAGRRRTLGSLPLGSVSRR